MTVTVYEYFNKHLFPGLMPTIKAAMWAHTLFNPKERRIMKRVLGSTIETHEQQEAVDGFIAAFKSRDKAACMRAAAKFDVVFGINNN